MQEQKKTIRKLMSPYGLMTNWEKLMIKSGGNKKYINHARSGLSFFVTHEEMQNNYALGQQISF